MQDFALAVQQKCHFSAQLTKIINQHFHLIPFGGARGGANGCFKYLHLESVFFTDSQHFAWPQNGFGVLLFYNAELNK